VRLGTVQPHQRVVVRRRDETLIDIPWPELKEVWLSPLDWS
jgi:hypothetical protein